jgi:hypothetical protein
MSFFCLLFKFPLLRSKNACFNKQQTKTRQKKNKKIQKNDIQKSLHFYEIPVFFLKSWYFYEIGLLLLLVLLLCCFVDCAQSARIWAAAAALCCCCSAVLLLHACCAAAAALQQQHSKERLARSPHRLHAHAEK